MAAAAVRVGRLASSSTKFLCCDLQERFRPTIAHFTTITHVCARLVKAANAMSIPVVVTEQYPKALGNTIAELQALFDKDTAKVFEKTQFSMVTPEVLEQLTSGEGTESVVLFGIEAHICVQQTALDLTSRGYNVHVVADACSSRTQADRMVAFDRMRHAGVFVTTHESVLFELLGGSDHPGFKDVSKLISDLLPPSELVPPPPQKRTGLFS